MKASAIVSLSKQDAQVLIIRKIINFAKSSPPNIEKQSVLLNHPIQYQKLVNFAKPSLQCSI